MPRIPDADLERLKQNVSLAELCRARGIELKPQGKKDLVGHCPFHQDDSPSFIVSPAKNLFHCMGCDAAGSVIDFVMQADGVDFRTAVDNLFAPASQQAASVSSEPSVAKHPATQAPVVVAPEKARQLLERVVLVYEKTFAEAPEARAYLTQRGITDAGLYTCHRAGYANGKLLELLPSGGTVRDELKAIGVLLDNAEERFKNCVVFPVYAPDGELVTLYGRRIEEAVGRLDGQTVGRSDGQTVGRLDGQTVGRSDSRKQYQERQTRPRHFYLPDRPTGMWNAAAVKTHSEIILVESIIDALSVMMAGCRHVVAIQGTNGFDDTDHKTLHTHGVQAVTLLLDGDEPGIKAAERLKEKISSSFSCRLLTLPDGLDPNAFLQKHGPESLARFLDQRSDGETVSRSDGLTVRPSDCPTVPPSNCPTVPPSDRLTTPTVTYGLRKYRIMSLEKGPRKLKATLRVEHAGKLHVDTLDFYAAKSRRSLAQDLCRIFEEPPEIIEGDIEKLLRHCELLDESQIAEVRGQKSVGEQMSAAERKEAEAFGQSPTLFDDILADCERRGLLGERNNALLLYVAMTSRKRDVPLSVLILSSSGAGKTALQDAVLSFCPPEDLVKLTALSGKALFYKERLALKHKVLALEEGDGAEEAMYAIRNLISAGELTSESTIKDLATGRLITMENKVEGPSCVCFTTTKPDVDPETKSRFWVTSIDESRDQTRKIMLFQRQQHLSDGLIVSPQIEAILRKHRNFQRLLKPLAVKNPYAQQLAYADDRLQGRRDQPKYLNLIKAVAFLRQMQKEVRGGRGQGAAVQGTTAEYIEVDATDIAVANRLAHEILGHSLNELSRPGGDLLLQLEALATERAKRPAQAEADSQPRPRELSFSRRDIREHTGWSNTRLHVHLKELVDFEYIAIETGRNGMPFRYRLAWEGQGKDGKRFLLGLTEPDKLHCQAPATRNEAPRTTNT